MPSPIVDDHIEPLAKVLEEVADARRKPRAITTTELERRTGSPRRYIERIGADFLDDVNERLEPRRIRVRYETPVDMPAVFHVDRIGERSGRPPR
jgi:hypothetical protein